MNIGSTVQVISPGDPRDGEVGVIVDEAKYVREGGWFVEFWGEFWWPYSEDELQDEDAPRDEEPGQWQS